MKRFIFVLLVVALANWPQAARADHDDNAAGHSGAYLFLPHHELNSRTTTGQSIPVLHAFLPASFGPPLISARNQWNSDMSAVTGFNVFSDGTGGVAVNGGVDPGFCGLLSDGSPAHGCLFDDFNYNAAVGGAYMYAPAFNSNTHRQSDLMHELGHVLYHAGEHYTGAAGTYNCSSIMGHCNSPVITTVQAHDKSDYRAAFRIIDAPNAAYGQLTNSTNVRHFFEGAYFSTGNGNGITIHSEDHYILDRSNGIPIYETDYLYDRDIPRVISNTEDGAPNTYDVGVPGAGQEWCYKIRGETKGVPTNDSGRFGPRSRAYCIGRSGSGSGVFLITNRNDYVAFRVWNYSGATINNVVITLDDANKTQLCNFGNIGNSQSSAACFAYLGTGSGYVNLYYNFGWMWQDQVGYDSR